MPDVDLHREAFVIIIRKMCIFCLVMWNVLGNVKWFIVG